MEASWPCELVDEEGEGGVGWLGGRRMGVVVDDRAKKEVEERREKPEVRRYRSGVCGRLTRVMAASRCSREPGGGRKRETSRERWRRKEKREESTVEYGVLSPVARGRGRNEERPARRGKVARQRSGRGGWQAVRRWKRRKRPRGLVGARGGGEGKGH